MVGKYFTDNGITFDAAYSSTQERAWDTLEIVTDNKMRYERLKGLKEWNFGVFEGESEDLNPKHPNEKTYGDFFVNFGGESNKDVEKRMQETLTRIMEKDGNNTVLAVSHGGAYYNFFLKNAPNVPFTGLPNCAIFKYEYEDGNFTFIELIKHNFSK